MTKLIGYKIVKKDLTSSFMNGYASVQYKIGKWVYPKKDCGPLAVFTNLNDAKENFRNNLHNKIFRCKYKISHISHLANKYRIMPAYFLPYGTDFAESVKLLEEIKNE